MNSEEKLLEIYDIIKENCLSIEQWGSSVLPYIDNSNDIDIDYVFKTKEQADNARRLINDKYKISDIKREYNVCIHFRSLEYDEMNWLGAYQTHFAIPLFDFNLTDRCKNIFTNKEDYLQTIKNFVDRYGKNHKRYILKQWYHIYTGLSMLKNNSYELTEEQIKNINLLRTKDIEAKKDLIDSIIKEVEGE